MDQQYNEIMRLSADLAERCREGLEQIKAKLNEGGLEDTMAYFNHIANSFYNILESIQPLLGELSPNELEFRSKSLHEAFGAAVKAYEAKDRDHVLEVMQFTLIPAYNKWQGELERCFRPYIEVN
ncbi:MAG: hypothetical protein FH756_10030 [Firmicutes bacterium]|nr:hypothetical protein [Bacillota bacterium]